MASGAGASAAPEKADPASARRTAHRQLNRLLLLLAALDFAVLAWVIAIASVSPRLHVSTAELVLLAIGGIVVVLGTRLVLAVRLRPRQGVR